jgi:hypothetical protein
MNGSDEDLNKIQTLAYRCECVQQGSPSHVTALFELVGAIKPHVILALVAELKAWRALEKARQELK